MQIDHIIFPCKTLGPGNRIVVYMQGCNHRIKCEKCSNPELWPSIPEKDRPLDEIIQFIESICRNHKVDGITFTGGEPLAQIDELLRLCEEIKSVLPDIFIFTGYCKEELNYKCEETDRLWKLVTAMVTGPYVPHLNLGFGLLGSSNQVLIINCNNCPPELKEKYLEVSGKRPSQPYLTDDGAYVYGIPTSDKEEDNDDMG